jgi:hypothetical protein
MAENQNNLELKKYRLEILKAFLSVLTPLLIFGSGYFINRKLDDQNKLLKKAELNQNRIDLMQKIVPQLFDTNTARSLAMMLLLDSIDANMANTIRELMVKKYAEVKQSGDTVASSTYSATVDIYDPGLKKKFEIVNSNYQSAANFEKAGLEEVVSKNANAAIANFAKADSVYPGFHNAWEIKNYLGRQRDSLRDPSSLKWKEVTNKISTDYKWKLSPAIKKKLAEGNK